jgi:hypothetical protein
MIEISFALFVLLVVAWLAAPTAGEKSAKAKSPSPAAAPNLKVGESAV